MSVKTVVKIAITLLIVVALGFVVYLANAGGSDRYVAAKAFMAAGEYLQAAEYFDELGDYKDSAALADQAWQLYNETRATPEPTAAPTPIPTAVPTAAPTAIPTPVTFNNAAAAVASPYDDIGVDRIVQFGAYEQDGNPSSKEPIEWVILKSEGSRKLLLSRYALDAAPFDSVTGRSTWSNSSLRAWLNGAFYNSTFSSGEQQGIMTTSIAMDANHWYPAINPGQDTLDHLFLLSVDEYERYVVGAQGASGLMSQEQLQAVIA